MNEFGENWCTHCSSSSRRGRRGSSPCLPAARLHIFTLPHTLLGVRQFLANKSRSTLLAGRLRIFTRRPPHALLCSHYPLLCWCLSQRQPIEATTSLYSEITILRESSDLMPKGSRALSFPAPEPQIGMKIDFQESVVAESEVDRVRYINR